MVVGSSLLRYFATNSGWTLPALFSVLRDLRDLAFDVGAPFFWRVCLIICFQADLEASSRGQEGTANMEEAARIISKAFSSCVTDRQAWYLDFILRGCSSGQPQDVAIR